MFFDGAHDSKKKVSLGGKKGTKAQESKQDFLERTKREREEREQARRRERAALSLQGFVRGRKILIGLREAQREGWDNLFQSIIQEWSGNPSLSSGNIDKRFAALLRRFLFFYRDWHSEDGHRLSKVANWLAAGSSGPQSGPPGIPLIVSMASDVQEGAAGLVRLFGLCQRSLSRLGRAGRLTNFKKKNMPSTTDEEMPVAEEEEKASLSNNMADAALLLRLFDGGCWISSANVTRRVQVISKLLDTGLMQVVRKHFDRLDVKSTDLGPQQQLQNQLQVVLCGAVVHALNSGVPRALDDFCTYILTKPLLFQSLNKASRQMLEFKNLWELCLSSLSRNDCVLLRQICQTDGGDGSAGILGNLIAMSAGSLSSASPQATGRFAACACHLLHRARLAYQRSVDAGDVVMDDDDDDGEKRVVHRSEIEVETAAGRVVMQHVRVGRAESEGASAAGGGSRNRFLSSAMSSIREHIAAICNREYVTKLLDVVQRIPPPGTNSTSGGAGAPSTGVPHSEDHTIIAATSGLLLQLTSFLPESKLDMLNALAFKPSVLERLWEWICCTRPQEKAAGGGYGDADPSLVTLFCLVYNYRLLTSDHSEFYERQYPFSLAAVREMVGVIKNIVVPLYWTQEQLSEPQLLLRNAGTALLSSLLERNCYREFAPPMEWQAADRCIATVVAELDGSLAARLMNPDRDEGRGLEPRHQAVLERLPFVLPFALRVRILRHLVALDRRSLADSPHHWIRCTIKRARVVEDSYLELNKYGPDLRQTIQVSFVNHEGLLEAGIDGGGLFKEFVNTLSRQAFNPSYGLFCQTAEGLLYPNPQAETAHPWQGSLDHLRLFEFLGRIVGKAIFDGILVELRLAPFFLRRMLGQALHFDDLRSLDPELHKNLLFVRSYDGDFEDLALNFVVVEDRFGEAQTVELIPGGAAVSVTRDNVLRYRHLVSDYWLNRRIKAQSEAFMRGLRDLVRPEWIRAFSPSELQTLLAGAAQPIDLGDLRAHCHYGGGYTDDHPSVQLFWEVVEGFGDAEREALLLFVTSCSRPPLLGFRDLHPSFCIQKTAHPPEEADSRLPTASTCMNLLKLPSYTNAADLKERLLYAVSAGAGFELS